MKYDISAIANGWVVSAIPPSVGGAKFPAGPMQPIQVYAATIADAAAKAVELEAARTAPKHKPGADPWKAFR